ncbi:MAG: hypothetical protein HFH14_00630 [Lachnospiraceae bacterium]|nr:hypothetical protein [Lachnospiraceae bacterium]
MIKTENVNRNTLGGAAGSMQTGGLTGNRMSDPVAKNIQNQIATANEKLSQLSSDEKMSLEEKMKKRQELSQEIASLNRQLRQRQIEQRKNQSKGNSMEDYLGGGRKTESAKSGGSAVGMSQSGMQAIISADATMKQARVQGSVITKMEGKAGVLKAEIKQDKGKNTETKEAELAEIEQRAMDVNASRMNTIADVNNMLNEASEADNENRAEKTDMKNDDKESEGKADKTLPEDGGASLPETASQAGVYRHVDINL